MIPFVPTVLLAFAALFVKAVVVTKAVVLIIFTVCIKGFRQLLRLISIA
jgi:hypothetical protein